MTPADRLRRIRLADFDPSCPLLDRRGAADPIGRCNWCGEPLPLTQKGAVSLTRRFDRATCSDRFWRNHGWSTARHFAVIRAKLPLAGSVARVDLLDLIERAGGGWLLRPRCERCYRATFAIEVNHVSPRNGGGYGNGCHHHQTNLEPLCHACHVAETTRQIRERRGIPEGGPPRTAVDRFPGERPLPLGLA